MAQEIRVPRLGWSMEEGTFVRWLKRDGEAVKIGEPIYELEGEKATQEIEAVDTGFLRIPPDAPPAGTVVLVGALLGYVAEVDELTPWENASAEPVVEATAASLSPPPGQGPAASPAAIVSDRTSGKTPSTPRARRIAAELGVDWTQLQGTGRNGRVREVDVIATNGTSAKLSARRRTIADRMLASRQRTVPVTLTTRADVTELVALREHLKSQGEVVPSYFDILAVLVTRVLAIHPHIASRWNATGDGLIAPDERGLNIGIAVDTPEGLVVPVLQDVGSLSLAEVATQSRGLIERARAGTLSSAEMSGGHFTITNLGAFGIDAFTPVINYPESAILGVGAIRREPVFTADDQVISRQFITLSLTFDHRAYDGAPAARFLQAVVAGCKSLTIGA